MTMKRYQFVKVGAYRHRFRLKPNVLFQITIQVLVSVAISIIGIVRVAGELKDIHSATELANKSWETLGNRQSFYMFRHRGKKLFQNNDEDYEEG